jgi:RNA polymerase sigma-70 factor (ECF subfamily)
MTDNRDYRHEGSNEPDCGRLWVQAEPRIYGFIRSLVPQRVDAEEVLQETASVVWQKFGDFEGGTSFLAWSLQIARYKVLHFRRKQGREALVFGDQFFDAIATESLEESTRLADMHDALAACLAKLSKSDREMFVRRYQTDVTTKTLAKQLDRPATTIYSALHRIRTALVECVRHRLTVEETA